jgi:hypothetical protein
METNKDLTAIEMAVKLSKVVLNLKILLQRLRNVRSFMGSVPGIVFHTAKDDLDKSIEDVRYNLYLTEERIGLYLKPSFKDNEYTYPTMKVGCKVFSKHSFSVEEMVDGFATVERVLEKSKEGVVLKSMPMALLLSTHKDSSDLLNLSAGQIISFEEHKDLLRTLQSVMTDTELHAYLKPNYSCTFNIEHLFPKLSKS